MYVEEENRSWCSSNSANDNRAVTIEVANDEVGEDWHVSDTALAKLINLCVDICQRNGISRINYTGDKSGNLTMHKWFAATACPGPYLESKFPYIAEQINARLEGTPQPSAPMPSDATPYRVRIVIADLNIRKGPGTNYGTVGHFTGKGVFTIVGEAIGTGATKWGLLKSYQAGQNGWISLDYAAKL